VRLGSVILVHVGQEFIFQESQKSCPPLAADESGSAASDVGGTKSRNLSVLTIATTIILGALLIFDRNSTIPEVGRKK
jgi:hypothetical protein